MIEFEQSAITIFPLSRKSDDGPYSVSLLVLQMNAENNAVCNESRQNVKNYVCLNAGQKTGIYIENYQIIIVFGLAVTLISTTT